MRFIGAVALVVTLLWVPVDGVAQGKDDPLRGIRTVLPSVDLFMDVGFQTRLEEVSAAMKEQYDQEIKDAFELELLRAGLELNPTPGRSGTPPLLICETTAVVYVNRDQPIPLMITLTEVKLKENLVREAPYDPSSSDGTWMLDSWTSGHQLLTTHLEIWSARQHGQVCADEFVTAWRRANN